MSRELLLGIDLGTSAVKAAIFDRECRPIASASAEYPTLHPKPGYAEQQPEDWWNALCRAVRDALVQVGDSGAVSAIGLSGQMHGTLLHSATAPIGNAITWQDRRSSEFVKFVAEMMSRNLWIDRTGGPLVTGFQAATIEWLVQNQPEQVAGAESVFLPKDFLRFRMTGVRATDPSDASGTGVADSLSPVYDDELANLVAWSHTDLFPPILPSIAQTGSLLPNAAADLGLPSGIPVFNGAADTAAAALAAGVVDENVLLLNLSTGGQLIMPDTFSRGDRTGRTHLFRSALADGAKWYHLGATLACGMALGWLRDNVLELDACDGWQQLDALAAQSPPGCNGLIFLPYLMGERTLHMDPHARGAFIGLTDRHRRAHLVRAVIEGATLAAYDAYLALLDVAPEPKRIILSGGGARSSLWRQIVANIFNKPVAPLLANEQSALGAALLAGEGMGWWDARKQALACARYGEASTPNPEISTRYAEIYDIYQDAYPANSDLFHRLAKFDM